MAKKVDLSGSIGRLPAKPLAIVDVRGVAKRGDYVTKKPLRDLINGSISEYRWENDVPKLIRMLAKQEGPFSAAVHNLVEVANCSYLITAYDSDTQEFHADGTQVAQAIIASMDTQYNFAGFSNKKSLNALVRHMLREVVLTGGLATELVLNLARLPEFLQVIPFETIKLKHDGKGGTYPSQSSGTEDIDLNIPTFFTSYMQHDADSHYPFSMMESAIKLIVYFEEFMEDIRRTVRRNGHTRTTVSLDVEKVVGIAPPSIKNDPAKLSAYLEIARKAVEDQIASLSPEDTVVHYSTAKMENLQAGLGSKVDYTPLLSTLSGMYATAMKTPPSAIGMRLESGSQALGNVESLIFIKSAMALQTPIEDVLSRALTLGARLYGYDVFVKFKFDTIDLRPETELQAFRTMEHQRIMELLSYGFYSDEYAAHLLRTGKRPDNAPALSGTMFASGKIKDDTTPGDTAMGRTLQPDKKLPRKGGGKSQ